MTFDGRTSVSIKKTFAAVLGAAAGAVVLAAPATAAPAAVDCTAYQVSDSGTVRPGYEAYPWSYFWSNGPESFSFCVDVPDSAEVVVDVREFSVPDQRWETVLTAPAGPGDKEFSYRTGTAATYRLYLTGVSGSGPYTAGLTFSRSR
ncbi:hypothetical protein [Actinoplanes sp. NPDC049265]|uniref:hypothetical protein n=1 Tax=Actinoplanes sp. NPDC049265 TaxID=3363902 RepID=UPI0037133443